MTQTQNMILIAFLFCLPTTALSDWAVRDGPTELIETDYAFGVSETGQTLNVFCDAGVPTVMAWGYPAQAGAKRTESLTIVVSSSAYSLTATHVPPDGLWMADAPDTLIEALRSGRVATVIPDSASDTVEINLTGSSRAISSALADCGNATSTAANADLATDSTAATLSDLAQIEADLAAACGGGYVLDDASLLTGLIDRDALPDFVLDWAGVICNDSSKGRGAGNCGINMCQISVLLSDQDNNVILGLAPTLVSDAFGRVRLKTIALRPSCPENALECVLIWNLTEEGLASSLLSQ